MKPCETVICSLTLMLPLLWGQEGTRGLGAMILEIDSNRLFVLNVFENSGAEIAGIQSGDFIEAIDGTVIRTKAEASATIQKRKIGERISIQVLRGDKKLTFATQLADKNDQKVEKPLSVRRPIKLVAVEKSGKSTEIAIGEWQETKIGEIRCCRLILGHSSVYAVFGPQFAIFPTGLIDRNLVLNSPMSLDSDGYLQQQQGELLLRILPLKK